MGEQFRGSGDNDRRPPDKNQLQGIQTLVRALTPNETEVRRRLAAGDDHPGRESYSVTDETGQPHEVLISGYEHRPHSDRPQAFAFVLDTALPARTKQAIHKRSQRKYYLDRSPGDQDKFVLRTDESGPPDEGALIEPLIAAQAIISFADSAEIAQELGADRANAAQAQNLADLLQLVQNEGVRRPPLY